MTQSSHFSRRTLLQGAGVLAASAVAPMVATPASAAPRWRKGKPSRGNTRPPATPVQTVATLVGSAPSALAVANFGGAGRLHTLFPYQNKIYYGYGDYGINSGSASGKHTDVAYLNTLTGEWGVDYTAYRTEEINTYRLLGGKLFAPCIDLSDGAPATNSFVSDLTGVWAANGGVPCEHLFDVCDSSVPGEYFVSGSSGGGSLTGGTVWRSTDYGKSWSEFFTEPSEADAYRDGFERVYWMARLGTKLYFRANNGINREVTAPLRWYDTSNKQWGKLRDSKLARGRRPSSGTPLRSVLGDHVYTASDVLASKSHIYFREWGKIYAFDGRGMTTLSGDLLARGSDGEVYVASGSTVSRIAGTSLVPVATVSGLPDIASFTVAGKELYFGTYNSQVWKASLV